MIRLQHFAPTQQSHCELQIRRTWAQGPLPPVSYQPHCCDNTCRACWTDNKLLQPHCWDLAFGRLRGAGHEADRADRRLLEFLFRGFARRLHLHERGIGGTEMTRLVRYYCDYYEQPWKYYGVRSTRGTEVLLYLGLRVGKENLNEKKVRPVK